MQRLIVRRCSTMLSNIQRGDYYRSKLKEEQMIKCYVNAAEIDNNIDAYIRLGDYFDDVEIKCRYYKYAALKCHSEGAYKLAEIYRKNGKLYNAYKYYKIAEINGKCVDDELNKLFRF